VNDSVKRSLKSVALNLYVIVYIAREIGPKDKVIRVITLNLSNVLYMPITLSYKSIVERVTLLRAKEDIIGSKSFNRVYDRSLTGASRPDNRYLFPLSPGEAALKLFPGYALDHVTS